jgi:hypothetical protein
MSRRSAAGRGNSTRSQAETVSARNERCTTEVLNGAATCRRCPKRISRTNAGGVILPGYKRDPDVQKGGTAEKDSGWGSLSLPIQMAGVLGLRTWCITVQGRKHPRSFTVPANLGERFVMASTSSHGQHLRARRASRESSSLFSCVSGTMVDTVYALESGVLSSFLMEGLLSSS